MSYRIVQHAYQHRNNERDNDWSNISHQTRISNPIFIQSRLQIYSWKNLQKISNVQIREIQFISIPYNEVTTDQVDDFLEYKKYNQHELHSNSSSSSNSSSQNQTATSIINHSELQMIQQMNIMQQQVEDEQRKWDDCSDDYETDS